jgi:hypothetical protein
MFTALWRRLRNRKAGPSRGQSLRDGGHSSLPRLESLEDRLVPALGAAGGIVLGAAAQGALPQAGSPASHDISGLQPIGGKTPSVGSLRVTVAENAPESVINLGPVFVKSGIQHQDGLRLAVLGNTNSGLVQTDLSETALTLTYTRGKCGSATITVSATDGDGVSVQEIVLVTVYPSSPVPPRGVVRSSGP